MRNNTKSRKNKNVNFRMPKKSKKMLVKNRVSSSSGVKK
jgi:hypothetical protein